MGDVDEAAIRAEMAEVAAKAKKAVKLTLRDKVDEANALLEDIPWEDPQMAATAMCTWADITAIAYRKVHGLSEYDGLQGINLSFVDATTREVTKADAIPAEWVWAGQFVAARLADDLDVIQGLMWGAGELGADAMVERINCVFHMAVMHMRQYSGLPL